MNRPPVRRRLIAVWAVLLLLASAIAYLEWTDPGASQKDTQFANRMLLPAPIEQLGAIEIAVAGALHRFERDAAGEWFYHGVHAHSEPAHEHRTDPVAAQRIAQAFAGFGRTKIERELALEAQGAEFGVTRPQMVVLVYGPGDLKPMMQYAVGDVAPDTISRYVLPVGSSAVVTIPNYQIENLLRLLEAAAGWSPAVRQPTQRP